MIKHFIFLTKKTKGQVSACTFVGFLAIKVFSRVFKRAIKQSGLKGKFHDLRKSFATRLYFLTGEEFTLCHALGHRDTSMTKQYTNVDKVTLKSLYPEIHAMKNGAKRRGKDERAYNKGHIELYSNFGFAKD